MRMPWAVRDFGRSFDQGHYLGFILGARPLLQAAKALPLAESSLLIMEGWAKLADQAVEEDRKDAPAQEAELLFHRERTLRALAEIAGAVDALGDGSQPALQGVADIEASGPALSHLDGVQGFVTQFRELVPRLDDIRTPVWRARWFQKPDSAPLPPIDAAALSRAVPPGSAKVTGDPAGAQTLTYERSDLPTLTLEVDARSREGKLLEVTPFVLPPGVESDEDREVALYDWVEGRQDQMFKQQERSMSCSFCGKANHEVKKLIAGPTAHICNECVQLCTEIIGDASGTASGE